MLQQGGKEKGWETFLLSTTCDRFPAAEFCALPGLQSRMNGGYDLLGGRIMMPNQMLQAPPPAPPPLYQCPPRPSFQQPQHLQGLQGFGPSLQHSLPLHAIMGSGGSPRVGMVPVHAGHMGMVPPSMAAGQGQGLPMQQVATPPGLPPGLGRTTMGNHSPLPQQTQPQQIYRPSSNEDLRMVGCHMPLPLLPFCASPSPHILGFSSGPSFPVAVWYSVHTVTSQTVPAFP